jgi:hypothetical protein
VLFDHELELTVDAAIEQRLGLAIAVAGHDFLELLSRVFYGDLNSQLKLAFHISNGGFGVLKLAR